MIRELDDDIRLIESDRRIRGLASPRHPDHLPHASAVGPELADHVSERRPRDKKRTDSDYRKEDHEGPPVSNETLEWEGDKRSDCPAVLGHRCRASCEGHVSGEEVEQREGPHEEDADAQDRPPMVVLVDEADHRETGDGEHNGHDECPHAKEVARNGGCR